MTDTHSTHYFACNFYCPRPRAELAWRWAPTSPPPMCVPALSTNLVFLMQSLYCPLIRPRNYVDVFKKPAEWLHPQGTECWHPPSLQLIRLTAQQCCELGVHYSISLSLITLFAYRTILKNYFVKYLFLVKFKKLPLQEQIDKMHKAHRTGLHYLFITIYHWIPKALSNWSCCTRSVWLCGKEKIQFSSTVSIWEY